MCSLCTSKNVGNCKTLYLFENSWPRNNAAIVLGNDFKQSIVIKRKLLFGISFIIFYDGMYFNVFQRNLFNVTWMKYSTLDM